MKILRIFKTFSLTTGFLLVVLISLIAFSSRFDLPGGFRAYSVLTGSMEPLIQTGSLIVTFFPTSTSHIRPNTVITFEEPGYENKFITHRVTKIVESKPGVVYQTQGDANSSPDPWLITYGRIKGVYLMHFPYLGSLLEFIRSLLGIILFIVIPVLLIVLDESKNIISALADIKIEKERKRREREIRPHSFIWIIFIPLVVFGISQTRALFFSSPVSLSNNVLSVAQASPSPSASPSITPSENPSPTPSSSPSASPSPSGSPSPSSSPTGGTTIIIEGNGDGSSNNVNLNNSSNCSVNQNNNSNINFNIDSSANSGGNSGNSNTGDSSSTVNVNVTNNSNSSTCP